MREKESEITSVSGALAGSRAEFRSRKPKSCLGTGLERRPDSCVDMPSVTSLSDTHVEEGAGYGDRLPFGGSSSACEVNFGDCSILMSLRVSHLRVKAVWRTGEENREGD